MRLVVLSQATKTPPVGRRPQPVLSPMLARYLTVPLRDSAAISAIPISSEVRLACDSRAVYSSVYILM
jgi:hypothetical protein